MRRSTSLRSLTATALAGLLLLAGCSGSAEQQATGAQSASGGQSADGEQTASASTPPTDASGMAAYGCALVSAAGDEGGPVDSWQLTIGDDAGPPLLKTSAAVGLLGGPSLAPLPGYEDLKEPAVTIYKGLSRVSTEKIQTGLTDLTAACQTHDLATGGLDTGTEARVDYACALADAVQNSGVPAEEWMITGGQVGGSATPSSTAASGNAESGELVGNQVVAVSSLLGALVGWHAPQQQKLSEAAAGLMQGAASLEPEAMADNLATITRECDQG